MSESTNKAQRRELRKAVGSDAANIITQYRQVATALEIQHRVLARQLQAVTDDGNTRFAASQAQTTQRIDGVAAWCKANEDAIAVLRQTVENLGDELREQRVAIAQLRLGPVAKLRQWLTRR